MGFGLKTKIALRRNLYQHFKSSVPEEYTGPLPGLQSVGIPAQCELDDGG